MQRLAFSIVFLSVCGPLAAHADVQTTGDCAGIVPPKGDAGSVPAAGDFECTGDVTIDGDLVYLRGRNYTVHGNLKLQGTGYLFLDQRFTVYGDVTVTTRSHLKVTGGKDMTALTVTGNLTIDQSSELLVSGKHELTVQGTNGTGGRLDVKNASWIEFEALSIIKVRADTMTLDKGTSITTGVDSGLRSVMGCGPGQGGPGGDGGGGASHAGIGSDGVDGRGSKVIYGSLEEPDQPGSCGGACSGTDGYGVDNNCGGLGGPAIRLQILGELKVDGSIAADGSGGGCNYYACSYPCTCEYFGGAGSGGSIWISAETLSGAGAIHATGGKARLAAGNGGGGRVAIYAPPGFKGTITASGSGSSTEGRPRSGDGTVYFNPPWPSPFDAGWDSGDALPAVEPPTSDAAVADAPMGDTWPSDLKPVPGDANGSDLRGAEAGTSDDAFPEDAPAILSAQDAAAPDQLTSAPDAHLAVDTPNAWLTPDGGALDGGHQDAATSKAQAKGCGCDLGGKTEDQRLCWLPLLLGLALARRRGQRPWLMSALAPAPRDRQRSSDARMS